MAKFRRGPWKAVGSDGRAYEVIEEVTPHQPLHTFEGGARPAGGFSELFTADGQDLNRLSKGEYEIVVSGVRLTSPDPAAP